MCTAISYKTKDHYFGRTLDFERSYNESVVISPRNFSFPFRRTFDIKNHYALIGMATVINNYPLYFDASNENGLSMAGLLFSNNAKYLPYQKDKNNVTPFEFIPWILGQCTTCDEARKILAQTNLLNLDFSTDLPHTPLHWLISDREQSIVVEPESGGIKIYENPVGVLTNNPTFNIQYHNLSNYMSLSSTDPQNNFLPTVALSRYSRGMGALGLPGDFSSESRFIKTVFVKTNSVSKETEFESVNQFFHILSSVAQIQGCVKIADKSFVITQYTSCCNTDRGIYYYTTYENRQIYGIDMRKENLDDSRLISYGLEKPSHLRILN